MTLDNIGIGVCAPYKLDNTSLIEGGTTKFTCRNVSWNSTGGNLSVACSDNCARIYSLSSDKVRDLLVVSGHSGPVTRTRFHPMEPDNLCTASSGRDLSVRLWDVRNASQRATGKIDLASRVLSVEWCPKTAKSEASSLIAVSDVDGTVAVFDTRKLGSSGGAGSKTTARTPALRTFSMKPYRPDQAIFSPGGSHLVSGTTVGGQGAGAILVWPWEQEKTQVDLSELRADTMCYQAHNGPIYALGFSPDGRRLASGGADATAGLWDVESMCCINALGRHKKFICDVAFSHDSKFLCVCSEDDGIDVMDAETGGFVGLVELSQRARAGGAEDIAFHPKANYLLACARSRPEGAPVAPFTIAKLSINSSSQ